MAVYVTFFRATARGHVAAQYVGDIVATEIITVPGTTTRTVQADETVSVTNGESREVLIAYGTNPDAATLTASQASGACFALPGGMLVPQFVPKIGDKINIKFPS